MKYVIALFILLYFSITSIVSSEKLKLGSDRLEEIIPYLNNKRVALVINHTSCLSDKNSTFLLDTLISRRIDIKKIFAPEHGFRGLEDAGKQIVNGRDAKTRLPVISLYGSLKKPTDDMLSDVDVVIFDIQDVGARFYTYISTMYYVMDACADNNKKFIVLDRPNPHDYIDGPVLDLKYKSFVGMYPIPLLHGLTLGELAKMTVGQNWLKSLNTLDLIIIPMLGWQHGQPYSLPIKPSPNLPNEQSIKLYASLCLFEATNISVGRGTYYPFQVVGYPNKKFGQFSFTPISLHGFDTDPMYKNQVCYGLDLRDIDMKEGFTLKYFISFYKKAPDKNKFFKSIQFMNLLSGTNLLRQQIINGMDESAIKKTWKADLEKYKKTREKYLLYTDKLYN